MTNKIITNKNGKKYQLREQLGAGAFAVVHKAIQIQSKKQYAIKIYKNISQQYGKIVKKQAQLLQSLDHKYIVKCYEYFNDKKQWYMVMDYCGKGDFNGYFKSLKKQMSQDMAFSFIYKLLDALVYLHQNNIVHRDLKLANILINDKYEIKLADFGFSKKFDEDNLLQSGCGTPVTMAPQILDIILKKNKTNYTTTCDTWSLGIISYYLVQNKYPFDPNRVSKIGGATGLREDIHSLKQIIYKQNIVLSDFCINFIQKCLTKDYNKRPTTKELQQYIQKNNTNMCMRSHFRIKKMKQTLDQESQIICKFKKLILKSIQKHLEQLIQKTFIALTLIKQKIQQFQLLYSQDYQNQFNFLTFLSQKIKYLQNIEIRIIIQNQKIPIKIINIEQFKNHTNVLLKFIKKKISKICEKTSPNPLYQNQLLKLICKQQQPDNQKIQLLKFITNIMQISYSSTMIIIKCISLNYMNEQKQQLDLYLSQKLNQELLISIINNPNINGQYQKFKDNQWAITNSYILNEEIQKRSTLSTQQRVLLNVINNAFNCRIYEKKSNDQNSFS